MTEEAPERRFSREYKLAALSRMAAGANVSALAKELGVPRKGNSGDSPLIFIYH